MKQERRVFPGAVPLPIVSMPQPQVISGGVPRVAAPAQTNAINPAAIGQAIGLLSGQKGLGGLLGEVGGNPLLHLGLGMLGGGSLGQGLQNGLLSYGSYTNALASAESNKAKAAQEKERWQAEQQKLLLELNQRSTEFAAQQEVARLLAEGGDQNAIRAAMARAGNANATAGMFNEPDKTLVKVPDPNSPTGYRYTLRSNALGAAAPGPSSTSFRYDPKTGTFEFSQGGELSKPVMNDVQADEISALKMLNRLGGIASAYKDNYLTYGGKLEAGAYALADKAGVPLSDEQKGIVKGKTEFTNSVKQLFNQYRKEITGAAASVQELKDLRDSLLNTEMSPVQFQAAYDQYVSVMRRQLILADELRNQGFSGKAFVDALNNDYSLYKGEGQKAPVRYVRDKDGNLVRAN